MKATSFVRLLLLALIVTMLAAACAPAPTAVPPAPTTAPTQAPAATQAAAATTAPTAAPTVAATKPAAATTAPTAAATATSIRSSITGSGCHLILSTTTSTADSGLLPFILPDFEKKFNCKVDVVAVGTGQAIAIGQKGDADALLVHDRKAEDQFVADGHAKERLDVMYNDFILVGPKNDPAKITGTKYAKDAFKAIMDAKATFASRGDKSGTNTKELGIWASLAVTPTKDMAWYNALGQGMGDTLLFANEKGAYTLTDRATWLAQQSKLSGLTVVTGGNNIKENADKDLLNPYGTMAVDPVKHPGVNSEMANNFVKWITSVDEQKVINTYGVDKFGQQLFYASSKEYLNSLTPASTGAGTPAATAAPTKAATSSASPAPTGAGTPSGAVAPSGSTTLDLSGAFAKPQTLTLDAIKKMNVVTINASHPKTGAASYQGVRVNAFLDLAQIKPEATKLVLTASDGFSAELAVADVTKCADCLLAINANNKLDAAMPNMASNAWVKDVVKIQAK